MLWAGLALACSSALADGGALLLHQQVNGLVISVFGAPAPLRKGAADLSIMVQSASNQAPMMDADLRLHVTTRGQPEILTQPTHRQATNKLLYAAQIEFPAAGVWRIDVACRTNQQQAEAAGTVTVLQSEPALLTYWPYFALVPAGIFLFALNQWLKKERRVRNRPTRP
jgi:hypothetical protein